MWYELTIVTSVTGGYGKYLSDWAKSIVEQIVKPLCVVIFTHGDVDGPFGATTSAWLSERGIMTYWHHSSERLDFGVARNRAVSYAQTEWVMHFDCDDELYPKAIEEFQRLSDDADVISAGYTLSGAVSRSTMDRHRLYRSATGIAALDLPSICSGISPFRKSFWERSPYRTNMLGAWDTALWIGFAKLGARFRATTIPVFKYRQHEDSIFNRRRRINGWTRAKTTAQLKALRRSYHGTAIIIPRDMKRTDDREPIFQRVRAHYAFHHPEWELVVGACPSVTWIKGAAINAALTHTLADVLVIADADCIVDPAALQHSVDAVLDGAPWSMPHHLVYRANRGYTDRICGQSADILPVMPFEDACDRRYEGAAGGGIFVIRRESFDAIGGMPCVFHGWGSEDRTFSVIADTLLGPCVRGDADLLHLWHTPQSHVESANNLRIAQRIGSAALQGPDALSMTLSSLTHTAIPTVSADQRHQMQENTPLITRIVKSSDPVQRRRIP